MGRRLKELGRRDGPSEQVKKREDGHVSWAAEWKRKESELAIWT
jgi:hypothetical protein